MWPKGAAMLLCLAGLSSAAHADCNAADQTPHGANMLIVLREQTVGRLKGVVSIGSEEEPGRRVVIEVYRYDGEAAGVDTTEFLQSAKRSAACLTDENGVFEFPRLKPGRYLLIAGTVESAGINEARMIVRITRWRRSHKIRIRLPLGT